MEKIIFVCGFIFVLMFLLAIFLWRKNTYLQAEVRFYRTINRGTFESALKLIKPYQKLYKDKDVLNALYDYSMKLICKIFNKPDNSDYQLTYWFTHFQDSANFSGEVANALLFGMEDVFKSAVMDEKYKAILVKAYEYAKSRDNLKFCECVHQIVPITWVF